jgi:hypothetical protein
MTLHRNRTNSERLHVGPAPGDERVCDEAGPHDRIRHRQAFPADLRFGDETVAARRDRRPVLTPVERLQTSKDPRMAGRMISAARGRTA